MPVPGSGFHPDNGVQIESFWTSVDEQRGTGGGGACAISDQLSLTERGRRNWIRLGELMTTTAPLDTPSKEPGTIEYWVEYTPPDAMAREVEDLSRLDW